MSYFTRPIEQAFDARQKVLHVGDLVAYAVDGHVGGDRPKLAIATVTDMGIGADERDQSMPVAIVEVTDGQEDGYKGIPTGAHNLLLIETSGQQESF